MFETGTATCAVVLLLQTHRATLIPQLLYGYKESVRLTIGGSHKNYFERTSFFLICIHKLCGKTRGAKTANENDYVTQGQLYLL